MSRADRKADVRVRCVKPPEMFPEKRTPREVLIAFEAGYKDRRKYAAKAMWSLWCVLEEVEARKGVRIGSDKFALWLWLCVINVTAVPAMRARFDNNKKGKCA